MKTCVAAVCGMFMLLVSCSGSREFKPAFNQPLQPVMQPGFVYVDQVAPLEKTNLKYAGYDLQVLVDADIRVHPQDYMVAEPDANIDFRRVRNLNIFFSHTAVRWVI